MFEFIIELIIIKKSLLLNFVPFPSTTPFQPSPQTLRSKKASSSVFVAVNIDYESDLEKTWKAAVAVLNKNNNT